MDGLDKEMALFRNALGLRSTRQRLLASNIANADTPHYKARDIDFKNALQDAMLGEQKNRLLEMARTHPGHLPGMLQWPTDRWILWRTEYQGAVDGNTVDMNIERAEMAKNSVHSSALVTFIKDEFEHMRLAMQNQ